MATGRIACQDFADNPKKTDRFGDQQATEDY